MEKSRLNTIIRPFARSSRTRAAWQIINTVVPYMALIYLMYFMLTNNVHFVWVLLLSIVPAFLLVRIFIFFHDCTHSSFLKSRKWMSFWGHIFGILTFTPYNKWKREHITHHRTVGNIDKRGVGDVWTMTVEEFEQSSWLKKLGYTLYRNPFIMFVIGPFYLFVIHERLPIALKDKKEWFSVMFTNVMIAGIITVVSLTVGFEYYVMIQLPIIFFASIFGVWMFFVQHQYEDVYWEHTDNWDIITASMKGSSVYRLPWILDWATGYIGYHNLHHINARIPNYRLKKAFYSDRFFQSGVNITFWKSFKLMTLKLYEEKSKRLIGYKEFRKMRKNVALN